MCIWIWTVSWVIFVAPFIAIPVFFSFRLYRSVVRYIGFRALWSIALAVTLYAVIWGLLAYEISRMSSLPMDYRGIPRSVILINWMLTIIVIGGSRVLARWLFTNEYILHSGEKTSVIVYGAGSAAFGNIKFSSEEKKEEASQYLSSALKSILERDIDQSISKLEEYEQAFPLYSVNLILGELKKNRKVLLNKDAPEWQKINKLILNNYEERLPASIIEKLKNPSF